MCHKVIKLKLVLSIMDIFDKIRIEPEPGYAKLQTIALTMIRIDFLQLLF